ncbi:WD40 repeat-like protein [Hesseltinella vesiculosa]|uniref:WD40 repeat-like protein n=1 Tax=Hesseltinella vesiculosa TaxID=101127 RepID=A0A1X2G592_9FUNG|nr:WD40 repeat-like protein [Hesseltinella vesiculosa]
MVEAHVGRFYEYQPATINSLSFTPPTVKSCRLAVGRANGDIEIWNPSYQYQLEKTIPGGDGQSVETLVWAHQSVLSDIDEDDTPEQVQEQLHRQLEHPPRLFSAGLNSYIVEWNTQTLTATKSVDSNGGAIWCLAVNSNGTRLAAGCEDGVIRLFDISDGQLEYLRSFDPQKGRILSIAWGPFDQYIVSGGSDSSVRRWDVQNGHVVKRMMVDRANKEPTMVWSVAATVDGTIVSGDSLGHLMFWNADLGTVKQSFKAHQADILSVVTSRDGSTVFSAGVDRKLVVCRHLTEQQKGNPTADQNNTRVKGGKWTVVGSRRYHWHDIRALALDDRPEIDSIVSGGVDVEMIVSPAREYPRYQHNRLPPFARQHLMSLSKSHRWIMGRFNDSLSIWKLGEAAAIDYSAKEPQGEIVKPFEYIMDMKLKNECYLTSASLSENAKWVAACDVESVRLFRIEPKESQSNEFQAIKMRSFTDALTQYLAEHKLAMGGHHVLFTPDSNKLILVTVESAVLVVDLTLWSNDMFEILGSFDHYQAKDSIGDQPSTVLDIAVSHDGQWLATYGDNSTTHVFNLDSMKRHYTLPNHSVPQTAMAFNVHRPHELAVAFADNTFRLYNVETQVPTKWSKKHAHDRSAFTKCRGHIRGFAFNPAPAFNNKMTLYGSVFLGQVDMSKPKTADKGTKRKVDDVPSGPKDKELPAKVYDKYQQILFCDYFAPDAMVIVERPKEHILANLPPSFYFKDFKK